MNPDPYPGDRMTTEDAFQAHLDVNPEDHTTRLVFADWLQERDDPRAGGYRALGLNKHRPWLERKYVWNSRENRWNKRRKYVWHWMSTTTGKGYRSALKWWWAAQLPDRSFGTRREADDAAALAFSRLPESRQRELLAQAPVTA